MELSKLSPKDLLGAVCALTGRPFLVGNIVLAGGVLEDIKRAGKLELIENNEEFKSAMKRLYLKDENAPESIYKWKARSYEGLICFDSDWQYILVK